MLTYHKACIPTYSQRLSYCDCGSLLNAYDDWSMERDCITVWLCVVCMCGFFFQGKPFHHYSFVRHKGGLGLSLPLLFRPLCPDTDKKKTIHREKQANSRHYHLSPPLSIWWHQISSLGPRILKPCLPPPPFKKSSILLLCPPVPSLVSPWDPPSLVTCAAVMVNIQQNFIFRNNEQTNPAVERFNYVRKTINSQQRFDSPWNIDQR
ncbi:hypothetical protein F5X96DRAFT_438527 [Biscogniauxia mediterranea]|nr:hypothetical protein F5X96DRAFT_438527 [Biscogniauxia mediterranea]